jgi:hypothetical protein
VGGASFFTRLLDHLFRDRLGTAVVLPKAHRQRRFDVDHFDARTVISEEINASFPALPHRIHAADLTQTLGADRAAEIAVVTDLLLRLLRTVLEVVAASACYWLPTLAAAPASPEPS